MDGPHDADAAAPADGLDLPDYYDQTLVSDVAVAPGGDRVAFVAREFDADEEESLSSLFVVPADGSRDPHRLTRTPGVSSPKWGPDGRRLAFLASREADVALRAATTKADDEEDTEGEDEDGDGEDGDGGKESDEPGEGGAGDGDDEPGAVDDRDGNGEEEKQVWVFDLELGGDARQVTTRPDGVTEFDWGPDGERLVVAARDPTGEQREYLDSREEGGPVEVERLQHKSNGRGWLDEVRTYLFVVGVADREERRLDDAYVGGARAEMMGGVCTPAWGAGDRIAFVANHSADADDSWALDCHTVRPDGTGHRRLTDGDLAAVAPSWSPDGERLAYLAGDPENGHVPADLRVVGPDGDATTLTSDLDRTVLGFGWAGEDALLAAVGDEGRVRLLEVGLDGSRRDAVPTRGEYASPMRLDVDPATGTAATVLSRPNGQNLYAIPGGEADAEPVRLTEYNADLFARSRVECERVTFEPEPGVEVAGLAYHPPGADLDGNRHPLVVDVHGGPMAFDTPGYRFRTHYWVAEGYVVLNVDYRGSTSYGRAFSEAIRGDWGPREAADVEAGVAHLVERGWVDPDRVFVTGFSQGGVNTAYVLAKTDVATAGAAEHGVYDAYSLFGTADTHVWYESDFGLPWEEPERYRAISSVTEVDDIDAPLLLTAGEADWRCPPTQAEQLYVSLKKRGVDSKLVVYPDVPHARGPPPVATHRLETVTDWFREHDPAVAGERDRRTE